MSSTFTPTVASLTSSGHEVLENLKSPMAQCHMYALALSEVRLPGSGPADVGGGYTLIFAGGPNNCAAGGVGLPLSPTLAAPGG